MRLNLGLSVRDGDLSSHPNIQIDWLLVLSMMSGFQAQDDIFWSLDRG